jgi:hypothetical protein
MFADLPQRSMTIARYIGAVSSNGAVERLLGFYLASAG